MATYQEAEDLINIGAYKSGSNPEIDEAIFRHKMIDEFLLQDTEEKTTFEETVSMMADIFSEADE